MRRQTFLFLSLLWFVHGACRSTRSNVLRVGASPTPHALILAQAKPVLAQQGISLEIVEMTDYVTPNLALIDGDLDANFYQHQLYLDQFNRDRHTRLVSVARVHLEPLGLYSTKIHALADLKPGAAIAIPNDPTNCARALSLLQTAGLIDLKKSGQPPTVLDVIETPRKVALRELESAQLPRALGDVAAAVINTNYAIEAGLAPQRDALIREPNDSPYANLLVVRPDKATDQRIQAVARALHSSTTKQFIGEHFHGALVPSF
jgi:D-methionine transport system substrate-binding protein